MSRIRIKYFVDQDGFVETIVFNTAALMRRRDPGSTSDSENDGSGRDSTGRMWQSAIWRIG